MADLSGKKVAILVDNYFEEDEFTGPLQALKDAGAQVDIIAADSEDGQVQALQHIDKSNKYSIDKTLDEANIDDYDALVLVSAGIAKGRKLTSYFTIQDDMRDAGANWVDEEVVVDGNIITSRKPDDVPAFNQALISMLAS